MFPAFVKQRPAGPVPHLQPGTPAASPEQTGPRIIEEVFCYLQGNG